MHERLLQVRGNQIPRRTLNLIGGDSTLADEDALLEDPVSMRLYPLLKNLQPTTT